VREFAQIIIDACGSDSQIVNLPMRPGEIPNSKVCADTSTLALVGMHHSQLVSIEDGVSRTVEDFSKRYFE
jgi:UDP-glucose 4-epimerase